MRGSVKILALLPVVLCAGLQAVFKHLSNQIVVRWVPRYIVPLGKSTKSVFGSGERDGVSYAVRHEQDLPKRPLRCRVGSSPTVPTAPISAWKAPPPLSPHRPQRDLLSPAHRLCVEISAERIPILAKRLLSLQTVLSHRHLDASQ